jgi:hypothetical protein
MIFYLIGSKVFTLLLGLILLLLTGALCKSLNAPKHSLKHLKFNKFSAGIEINESHLILQKTCGY